MWSKDDNAESRWCGKKTGNCQLNCKLHSMCAAWVKGLDRGGGGRGHLCPCECWFTVRAGDYVFKDLNFFFSSIVNLRAGTESEITSFH